MSQTRRLAAIFAADVAGYSRLIGADEEGTLRRLRSIRAEVIDPKIAEHHGRLVKTTGDGLLVEFGSVVDALRCATELQQEMARRNSETAETERIEYRIGVHQGDIVVDDTDILGDGVNVAARLEGIAEPGGICVSARVQEDVAGRVELVFDDLGEQNLKNIARPIRVYSVRVANGPSPAIKPALPLPDRPSIAVLPFQNMSRDPEQEYFVDGMVEEIITALSRIRWLFVIARNSSFTYKGQAVDVKRVGRELGVRYVLEGSVRKAGNRVRITGQLIDAETGAHLWADHFDCDLSDIFAVQDQISASVASVIEPALAEAEQKRVLRKSPERLDAWEAYQRGLWHFYKYGSEDNKIAQTFFRQAIALDANFAPSHHGYALALFWDFWLYSTRSFTDVQKTSLDEARFAVSLDDKDAMAHAVFAAMMAIVGEWEDAITEAQTALILNPNSAPVMGWLGMALGFGGYPNKAIEQLRGAMRASPHDPLTWLWTFHIGIFLFFQKDFDAALSTMRDVIRLRPSHAYAYEYIAGSLAYRGDLDEAREVLARARVQFAEQLERHQDQRPPWMRSEDYELRMEGLRLTTGEAK